MIKLQAAAAVPAGSALIWCSNFNAAYMPCDQRAQKPPAKGNCRHDPKKVEYCSGVRIQGIQGTQGIRGKQEIRGATDAIYSQSLYH